MIEATLSEFLLTAILSILLLLIAAIWWSGVAGGGVEIKRSRGWSAAFVFVAVLLAVIALLGKFSSSPSPSRSVIELEHVFLDWGSDRSSNTNGQRVVIQPPRSPDGGGGVWEWTAVSRFRRSFREKPQMMVSLVEWSDQTANARYSVQAIPLSKDDFEIRLTVWWPTPRQVPPSLQFQVDYAAAGDEGR